MKKVGLVGWRGMVGSVLMERMMAEDDFKKFTPMFFTTTQAGQDIEAGKRILIRRNRIPDRIANRSHTNINRIRGRGINCTRAIICGHGENFGSASRIEVGNRGIDQAIKGCIDLANRTRQRKCIAKVGTNQCSTGRNTTDRTRNFKRTV